MPGPLDFLKGAWNSATTPLVPQRAVQPLQDAIDDPAGDYSDHPLMARLRGFGAGALEGVRSQTDPLSVGSAAVPYLGGIMKGFKALRPAAKLVEPTLEVLDDIPTPQSMPGMGEVDDLISGLKGRLGEVPDARKVGGQRVPGAQETLGERAPEFTPVGAEWNLNQTRVPTPPKVAPEYDQAVGKYLQNWQRNPFLRDTIVR